MKISRGRGREGELVQSQSDFHFATNSAWQKSFPVAYHFCLASPTAFTQPVARLLAELRVFLSQLTWYFCGMNSLMGGVGRMGTRWVLLGALGDAGQALGVWQVVLALRTDGSGGMKLPS